jgi:hypothetical protein
MQQVEGQRQFETMQIGDWKGFTDKIDSVTGLETGKWIYRGQSEDWPLASTLERRLQSWDIAIVEGTSVEREILREFRRCFQGLGREIVRRDTFYCLALMQHHGAPTRSLSE